MALKTAWYGPFCLGQGSFLTLFVAFLFEGMLGLIKALAELGRIDLTAVGISFGCVGWRFWQTSVLLLVYGQLSMILLLLGVGRREEIHF